MTVKAEKEHLHELVQRLSDKIEVWSPEVATRRAHLDKIPLETPLDEVIQLQVELRALEHLLARAQSERDDVIGKLQEIEEQERTESAQRERERRTDITRLKEEIELLETYIEGTAPEMPASEVAFMQSVGLEQARAEWERRKEAAETSLRAIEK